MEQRSHFRREESGQEHHANAGAASSAGVSSLEEVVRLDRNQTPVPARVTERLAKSIATEPVPVRAWWKRWLGK